MGETQESSAREKQGSATPNIVNFQTSPLWHKFNVLSAAIAYLVLALGSVFQETWRDQGELRVDVLDGDSL